MSLKTDVSFYLFLSLAAGTEAGPWNELVGCFPNKGMFDLFHGLIFREYWQKGFYNSWCSWVGFLWVTKTPHTSWASKATLPINAQITRIWPFVQFALLEVLSLFLIPNNFWKSWEMSFPGGGWFLQHWWTADHCFGSILGHLLLFLKPAFCQLSCFFLYCDIP